MADFGKVFDGITIYWKRIMDDKRLILVTGATGYVGGRLIPRLLEAGHRVRVITRDSRHVSGRSWLDQVEVVQGDVLKAATLNTALDGVDVAYYLVHSISARANFAEQDAKAAHNFAQAAQTHKLKQIIYLGGLGDSSEDLSEHLESRHEVGDILRAYATPVTEFRAAVVVGAGSISFEMVRYLTERLPVMITPKWLYTRTQPIAIDDVLAYLVAALDTPESFNQVVEIGGADSMPYIDMMMRYADAVHLLRYAIPVPLLAPKLSSYWVHLVTPISWDIAEPLIESLEHDVVVTNNKAKQLFPNIQPKGYDESVRQALKELDAKHVETSWLDSTADIWESDEPYTFVEKRGMNIEQRTVDVDATPDAIFDKLNTIGGQNGWFVLNQLWHLRGLADRLMGGVGNRRTRRDPRHLRVGDTLDFWRVENIIPAKMILLRAEMKLPGEGWLRFDLEPQGNGKTQLKQTAYFAPRGFAGWGYWTMLFVFHKIIFDGMIAQIKALAEQSDDESKVIAPTSHARRIAPVAITATIFVAVAAIASVLLRPRN